MDDIDQKIQELDLSIKIIENIIEASKIKRFEFTSKEKNALDVALDTMQANLAMFKEEQTR